MSLVVFSGPTLSEREGRRLLSGAEFFGPAECGDVYRAVRAGARSVALIDGYFDHRLSVWHKEILWALSRGVAVYGAASVGALRAAELHRFGMRGVGRVFEWFRDGVLEDDDEVAVIHEAPEREYTPLSLALVNLRRTLNDAVAACTLDASVSERVIRELKGLHYPDRDFGTLLQVIKRLLTPPEAESLEGWLARHGVTDQKREDAVALLQRLRNTATHRAALEPQRDFRFQHTNAWQALLESIDARTASARSQGAVQKKAAAPPMPPRQDVPPAPAVGDEPALLQGLAIIAQQDPALHARIVQHAFERALALVLADQAGASADAAAIQSASEHFRRERGLFTPEQTAAWLASNRMEVSDFSVLVHDTVLSEAFSGAAKRAFLDQLPSTLRILGAYADVAASD